MNQIKVNGLAQAQEVTQKGAVSRGFFPHSFPSHIPTPAPRSKEVYVPAAQMQSECLCRAPAAAVAAWPPWAPRIVCITCLPTLQRLCLLAHGCNQCSLQSF